MSKIPKDVQAELHKLLSVVDPSLVVSVSKAGIIHIGGKPAEQARLANLKAEAEFLAQSDLWKVINQSVRELAQRAMFVEGTTLDFLQKGRSVLYTLDSQQKMVDTFKSKK